MQKKNADSRLSVLELMWFVMHVITGHKNVNEEILQSSTHYVFLQETGRVSSGGGYE